MRSETIANAILEDRRNRKPTASRSRAPADDFDPFGFTRWRVVAGADPAYVVKTPMRRAPVGWFIDCQHCGGEFESLGLPYCTRCLEKPAEERRATRKPAERSTVAGATEHRGPVANHQRSSHRKATPKSLKNFRASSVLRIFPLISWVPPTAAAAFWLPT
jgi:hypothetical protein